LHNVVVTFEIESDLPEYDVVDPTDIPPATVHVFFEQKGDDLVEANGRWWADFSVYDLGSQDGQAITRTIPLTFDQWSNVYGQQNATAFATSFQNVGWIGLTFGGGYFLGPGVTLGAGKATFILVNF
jgi:hypothetical protein